MHMPTKAAGVPSSMQHQLTAERTEKCHRTVPCRLPAPAISFVLIMAQERF